MKSIIALLFFSVSSALVAQGLDIQGHRGSRGLLPENTIPAFIRAIDEGVTTLELDVVITKDKYVVVSHEPYMSSEICQMPNSEDITKAQARSLNIYQMEYSEVQLYDCGSRGNKRFPDQEKIPVFKPLLSDLIDEVEAYLEANNLPDVSYNIELKSSEKGDNVYHPAVDEFSDIVYALLEDKLEKNRYTIQCFDFRILKYWHERYPSVALVALIENRKSVAANLEALGFTPTVYSPYHIFVNEAMVKECHDKSMKVIPWTVNDRKTMEKLINFGVDGIITDYPDRAKGLSAN